MIEVRLAVDTDDVVEAYRIRTVVFVDEQGVPPDLELDELDDGADHVLAWHDDRAVGAGRLVVEDAGHEGVDPSYGPVGHLGRLAVLAEARGLGAGIALVEAIERRASERELRAMYLSAQTHALRFYERLGYEAYGDEFDDAGLPHRHMWRALP